MQLSCSSIQQCQRDRNVYELGLIYSGRNLWAFRVCDTTIYTVAVINCSAAGTTWTWLESHLPLIVLDKSKRAQNRELAKDLFVDHITITLHTCARLLSRWLGERKGFSHSSGWFTDCFGWSSADIYKTVSLGSSRQLNRQKITFRAQNHLLHWIALYLAKAPSIHVHLDARCVHT